MQYALTVKVSTYDDIFEMLHRVRTDCTTQQKFKPLWTSCLEKIRNLMLSEL